MGNGQGKEEQLMSSQKKNWYYCLRGTKYPRGQNFPNKQDR